MTEQLTHFNGIKITTENKCSFCEGALCCTYYTEELETPKSMHDFDHLLWMISHADTRIYKDDEGWYLLVLRKCLHLQSDGRCGIYDERPPADEGFDLFFEDYRSLEKYCRKRYKTWSKRFKVFAEMEDA
jgi:Fe-S-cluster containining protein